MKNFLMISLLVISILFGCQPSRVDLDFVSKVEGTYKVDEIVANGRRLPQTTARLDIKRVNYKGDRAYFTIYYQADRLNTPVDTFNAITYKVDLKLVNDSVYFYGNYGTIKFAAWANNIITCETFVENPSDADLIFKAVK